MNVSLHLPRFGHLYQLVPFQQRAPQSHQGPGIFNDTKTGILYEACQQLSQALSRPGFKAMPLPPDMVATPDFLKHQQTIWSYYLREITRKFPLPANRVRPPLDKARMAHRNISNQTLDRFLDLESKAYPVFVRYNAKKNIEYTIPPSYAIAGQTCDAPDEIYKALQKERPHHR